MSKEMLTADQLITARFQEQEEEIKRLKSELDFANKEKQKIIDIMTFVGSTIQHIELPAINPLEMGKVGIVVRVTTNPILDKYKYDEEVKMLTRYIEFMKGRAKYLNDNQQTIY